MTNPVESKCRIVYMDSVRGEGQTYFAIEYATLAEVRAAYEDQSDAFYESFFECATPDHYIIPKTIEVFTPNRTWINLDGTEKHWYGELEVRESTIIGEIT